MAFEDDVDDASEPLNDDRRIKPTLSALLDDATAWLLLLILSLFSELVVTVAVVVVVDDAEVRSST